MNLILLTAALRFNNLPYIAQSIYNVFKDHGNIKIHWMICYDKYNGYGRSLSDTANICKKLGITVSLLPSGKPNQKNYGGDLFNEHIIPLLENSFEGGIEDPWIYVLDDDNIVHPFLPYVLMKNIDTDKRIIWMSKHRETGVTDQAPELLALHPFPYGNEQYFTPAQLSPDPSQLLIKGSLILDVGGYGSGFTYDFEWCNPLCSNYKNEVAFFNHWEDSIDLIHCYHNGLRTEAELLDWDQELKRNNIIASHFYLETETDNPKPIIIPVDKDLAIEILQLIRSRYKWIE